ncbi:BCL2/adenovirus E1B 19 kDa protein-interacting protein 3-like isoform X3 [Halyomorpha halys]|uniref:BCL2/adenovirus E1B 19 kDa protein-interacting protein 3-like isoform X3 n=1 Tax=Halyomorpha halys TaxID=286706 RepID=UPI0006D51A0F|nr:BCL2/adenovirus E1B 19 kDa protein-interacting protein 3-like isoform X3 [Halyomorpha halys]
MDHIMNESWVEVGRSPERTTPLPFPAAEEYLRLLKEAQRESNQSSARHSLASSVKGSFVFSPKSPPNSPNTELSVEEELKGVYINYSGKDVEWIDKNTDWIWDWSSRPDQEPPKDWKFRHPASRKMLSIRTAKVGKVALFSREMMYTIVVTNVLSLLLGAGFGVWLSRRGIMLSPINLD